MTNIRETLVRLVSTDSVTGQETRIADELESRLRPLSTGSQSLIRIGDSLILGPVTPGASGRPLVVLAGHLDTVPLGDAWPPRVDGEILHGRGVVDMKAGVATMIHLAEELDPDAGFCERAFVFYTGEEGPAEGNSLGPVLESLAWLREAELAILLEPTSGGLELGCKGTLHCRVVFTGRACHSARPWTGLHPFEAALPWLEAVRRIPERPVEIAGVVFREAVVVTKIHAGEARNVSPGSLEVNLNVRYAPDRTPEEAERWARSLCPTPRPASPEGAAVSPEDAVGASVEIVDHAGPGLVDLSAPLFRYLLDATGLPREAKQGWTDVARFGAFGVPAVNWGAGDPLLCHRADERLDLREVEALRRAVGDFLMSAGPAGKESTE